MFLTIIKHENVTEPNWGEMKVLQVYPTNYPGYVSNLTLLNSPPPFPSSHVFRKEALTLQMLSSLSDQKDE